MTFVMDHRDYQHYFTTTHADFQAAVQPFTKGAGGLVSILASEKLHINYHFSACNIEKKGLHGDKGYIINF